MQNTVTNTNTYDDSKKKILIIDDEPSIQDLLVFNLEKEGYKTITASDGEEGVSLALSQNPDLILLDVMLPKADGLTVCKRIRQTLSKTPIIMLSAKGEEIDKILGLEIGADDYMTKPFNPLELIARVKSQLRRYTALGSLETKQHIYQTGGLSIDDEQKLITVDGVLVHLTPVQYKILRFLTMNAGKVYSIETIYEKVWNEPSFQPENTVAVHIRKIREKIEINPKEPKYLKVVWGIGYKVEKI